MSFCSKTKLPILGIVENMSGYVCPHCSVSSVNLQRIDAFLFYVQHCTNVFSRGGGEMLAKHADVPFLGSIPLDPNLAACGDEGKSFVEAFPESKACKSIQEIVANLSKRLE